MDCEVSIKSMSSNLDMRPRNDENTPLLRLERDDKIDEPTNYRGESEAVFIPRRYVVFVVFICYFLAGGIFAHACPQYTQHVVKEKYKNAENNSFSLRRNGSICYLNKTDPSFKVFTHIQQDTAKWSMAYPIASKLPALVTNLIWSSYSDVIGRKIVFIICLSGATARMFLFTFVVGFDLSLGFIVFGSVIDGLTGSFTTLFAVMFSYVSDITTPGKQRTIVIIMSELFRSISITVSAVGSGYVISRGGFLTTALLCVVIEVTGLLIAVCLLPETLRNHRNNGMAAKPTTDGRSSCVKRMLIIISETFMFYFKESPGNHRQRYILLILGFLFYGIAGMNRASIETLYLLGRPFCWTATKIGWFHAIKTAISAMCAMSITYGFRKHISDDTIATFSVTLVGVSYIVEGVANNEYVLYLGKFDWYILCIKAENVFLL